MAYAYAYALRRPKGRKGKRPTNKWLFNLTVEVNAVLPLLHSLVDLFIDCLGYQYATSQTIMQFVFQLQQNPFSSRDLFTHFISEAKIVYSHAPCTTLQYRSAVGFSLGDVYRDLQLPRGDDPSTNTPYYPDSWTNTANDVLLRTCMVTACRPPSVFLCSSTAAHMVSRGKGGAGCLSADSDLNSSKKEPG